MTEKEARIIDFPTPAQDGGPEVEKLLRAITGMSAVCIPQISALETLTSHESPIVRDSALAMLSVLATRVETARGSDE